MRHFSIIMLVVLLVSCGQSEPSESVIQTAIAQTAAAVTPDPTATPAPTATSTPQPTNTPEPTATPTPDPVALCADEVAAYLDTTEALNQEWNDALIVADSTARISLSGPVSKLQEIRREILAIDFPGCAAPAGFYLEAHYDLVIDSFLNFMTDTDYDPGEDFALSQMFSKIAYHLLDQPDRPANHPTYIIGISGPGAVLSYYWSNEGEFAEETTRLEDAVWIAPLPDDYQASSYRITARKGTFDTRYIYCAIAIDGNVIDNEMAYLNIATCSVNQQ